MYVAEFGPADAPPIVFLHGSMVAGWMWMGQVEDLSPDHRCIVPDFPGFDRSGDDKWTSVAATAAMIADLITSRCPAGSAHVVGLSLGGMIGLRLALDHPSRVRSLLVSGVPSGRISLPVRLLSQVLLWMYPRPWGARIVARAFGIPDDESREAFMQTARRTDPRALRAIMVEVNEAPLPAELDRLAAPVLAVVGERDTKAARRTVPYLVEALPRVEGRRVKAVGHQWNAEDRSLFSDMIRSWIDEGTVDPRLKALDAGRR